MKQTELLGLFEDGISREKLRKIEMRKDALMILKVKQKYDVIAKRMESPISTDRTPFVKLKDGRNLFEIEDFEIENINYIYELKFQELDYLRIKVLSLLPELVRLEVKFSNIWLPDLKFDITQQNLFINLQNIDLSFNNLTDEILFYIKSIKSLKTLNLMGNQITHEIPDLSELVNLEELNLSSNNIVSFFLNLNGGNKTEQSEMGNNTHVSHFNLMLSGKEFAEMKKKNDDLPAIITEKNENLENNTQYANKNNNKSQFVKQEDEEKERKISDIIKTPNDADKNIINKADFNRDCENLENIKNNKKFDLENIDKKEDQNHDKPNLDVSNQSEKSKISHGIDKDNKNDLNQENANKTTKIGVAEDGVNREISNQYSKKNQEVHNKKSNSFHEKMKTQSIYSNKSNNRNTKINITQPNNITEEHEFGEYSMDTYEEWQKFLRTNLQEFYHKLSSLKNLKSLNLSHNKIHFFDIDPYHIQQKNGFSKLNTLDISFNLIEEEISILLVMNIPNLKSIDITCNPITRKKTAFENIEYEIFKTKNILLINSKPWGYHSQIWEPPNKINYTRRKNFNKFAVVPMEEDKSYKVNPDLRIEPVSLFNNKIKSKIDSMIERRKRMDEEIIRNEIPEYDIDILENNIENLENIDKNLIDENMIGKEEKNSLKSILNVKKNKENVFLTNTDSQINKLIAMNNKNYGLGEGSENYINFLTLANKCFGKEKHYKTTMPISNAYQRLRFILNNLTSSNTNDNTEFSNRYMKSTISRSIMLDEYKPDNINFKKEFKLLKEINKKQVIQENEEEIFNISKLNSYRNSSLNNMNDI